MTNINIEFSDQLYDFQPDQIREYENQVKSFVIPDPNDELIHIYETDKLVNLIGIRAEKYDSPEHKDQLTQLRQDWMTAKNTDNNHNSGKEFKIPRGQQNPNYTELLELLSKVRKNKSTSEIISLVNFITTDLNRTELFKNRKSLTLKKLAYLLDVRLIDNPILFFEYLYTKYTG